MTILSSDLVFYGSANMPDNDSSTAGGAIATTIKPYFTQMAASDTLGCRSSSGSDTSVTIRITGRLASGSIDYEDFALNGTNRIAGAKTFDAGSKDITVAQADTAPSVIEIRSEEFDVDGGFDCLNVEVSRESTSRHAAAIFPLRARMWASVFSFAFFRPCGSASKRARIAFR